MGNVKEIQDVAMSRFTNGAHYTFICLVLARAEQDAVINSKAAEQVAALKETLQAEDDVLKLSTKSLLSDDIAKADYERDSFYAIYKKTVENFLAMSLPSFTEAARVLAQHIKDYRVNTKAKLDEETGLLVNFIADLEGKYKAQVEALSLTALVAQMKEANERVRSLTLQRTNERMGTQVGALKTARLATDEAYRFLVKWVNALALINGAADYESFIDYVNTEITHYKREVLGQKASSSSTSGNTNGSGSSEGGSSDDNTGGDSDGSSDGNSDNKDNPGSGDDTGSGSGNSGGSEGGTGSEGSGGTKFV